jgi:predicted DNA binding CopG/RHH family protein
MIKDPDKYYAPRLPEYEADNISFDEEAALAMSKEIREWRQKKQPTSIALDPSTIDELKHMAEKKGIPYQVLMRSFILEGIERAKKNE